MSAKKTLIYNSSEASGHHVEFILHLLSYIKDYDDKNEYIFILHHTMKVHIKEINLKNIHYQFLDPNLSSKLSSSSLLKRSLVEIKYLKKASTKLNIDKLTFLMIDLYQLGIGIFSFNKRIKISGILFKPYTRIPNASSNYIQNNIFKIYKFILLKILLTNRNIHKIWILNDEHSIKLLNKYFKTDKFKFLVDPIYDLIKIKTQTSPRLVEENRHSIELLVFGTITPIKNIINILRSIKIASKLTEKKIKLVILGKWASKIYKEKVKKEIDDLDILKLINLEIKDSYVNNDVIYSEFQKADIILIPYINFYFSSGVLGHAANHLKPILGSEEGLPGELIKKYNLGLTCNPNDTVDMAKKILTLIYQGKNYNKNGMLNYARKHSGYNFAKEILS